MTKNVVITGGCGYVGSHIAAAIKRNTDYKTIIIDSNANAHSYTHRYADQIFNTDYANPDMLSVMCKLKPVAIIHCAATSLVGPSVWNPSDYYKNNVSKLINLLDTMRSNGLDKIIFSSSSSVYGDGTRPSKESDPCMPVSPYGSSKLAGEMILRDWSYAYGIDCVSFRYFNAVGADPEGTLGQAPGASHLIAKIMESILNEDEFTINGNDYDTLDGTCVRDYVHVSDIADVHVKAIGFLFARQGNHVFNIGSGVGYSVMEIINAVESVTGRQVKASVGLRRAGDSAWRIADNTKLNYEFDWSPHRSLTQIVTDAWRWYNSDIYNSLYN